MRTIKKGAASQSLYFEVLDSASTTGGRKTGLVFNTASLTAYYARNGAASVAITLVTLAAASSAWASGGFKEVDATNMPGVYRLDVPDAAFASGAESVVVTIRGASGMVQASYDVQLVDNLVSDVYSRVGAPAGASVSADIAAAKVDTAAIKVQTDKLVFTVANQVDVNVLDWKSAAAPAMTGDAFARLGAPAGASVSADVAATKALLPTALVGGRMDASVGAMATDTLTSAALAASAVTEIQTGLSTLDAAAVRSAVGLASANMDTQLSTIAGYIDTEVTSLITSVGSGLNTAVLAVKAKTDNLPAAPAATSDIPTANANADALLDRTAGVETGLTVRQWLRLAASALFGKASGLATTTAVYRDFGDTKARITATVDADGNRTAVTRDAT